jgi:hypothetical protein
VVCAVEQREQRPTVLDVFRILSPGDSTYRDQALSRLDQVSGLDFARYYWRREFPELLRDRSRTVEVLDPPLNKLRRLLSTPQVDVVLRHPCSLDIEGAIAREEVIVLNGAKAVAGEDSTKLLFQLLLRPVPAAISARARRREMHLEPDDIEAIAERVVARLTRESGPRARIGLVTAADVAELYGVSVSWVYANKGRLGAVLLGAGPKARLRFDLERVAQALGTRAPAPSERPRRRRRRSRKSGLPPGVELLQARGRT